MSDLAHERLQVLDFEQSIYKPERGFHESGALEHGYVGIIVGCAVQRIRSFWRLEGRERAGLRFWEGQGTGATGQRGDEEFKSGILEIEELPVARRACRDPLAVRLVLKCVIPPAGEMRHALDDYY